uniref:C-type lectin domain-containing protein n=2 Tax=Caenorhabditis japonica TaxID=281687 RepID=A0A8R1J0X6_CAEJA
MHIAPISRMLIITSTLIVSLGVNAVRFDSDSSSSYEDKDSGGHHHHHHPPGEGGGRGGGGNSNGGNGGGVKVPACLDGWTLLQRPSGPWCVKIFPTYMTDYTEALALCRSHDALISGIQNQQETKWITQNALDTLGGTGSVWIGALRNANCVDKGKSAECNEQTAFYWADNSTTGIEGFVWRDSYQPDNAWGFVQNCVSVFYATTTVQFGAAWWPGNIDDTSCNPDQWLAKGPRELKGTLCGRPAR